MKQATGEYFMVMDADHVVSPGAHSFMFLGIFEPRCRAVRQVCCVLRLMDHNVMSDLMTTAQNSALLEVIDSQSLLLIAAFLMSVLPHYLRRKTEEECTADMENGKAGASNWCFDVRALYLLCFLLLTQAVT